MMIRKLMASSAMLALLTAGALTAAQAQTTPSTDQPAVQQPAATTDMAPGASDATLTPDQPTIASAYIGRPVYSSQDPKSDNIGNVNDLIIGDEGMITHAVVGVGGFLGIGEKDVAVPFDELEVVEEDDGAIRLIYSATRDQLDAAPAFDRTAFDPKKRAAESASAKVPAAGGEPLATAPAATTVTADTNMAAAPLAPAATDLTAAPAPAAPVPAGTFVNFQEGQMRASVMVGKELYGADDKSIGEVSDLVLDADGKTRSALVDVGGFLGIGEKRVAIPFSSIKMVPEADAAAANNAAAGDKNMRLTVAMTREQLNQAPAYQDPAKAASATPAPADVTTATPGVATTAMTGDAPAGATTAPADGAPAAGDAMAPANSTTATYMPVRQDMTAENLIGARVYGANDEDLGEVGDVIFDQAGIIQAVVVDVGGFLGIGEKPVAVQFDAMQVQRDASGGFRLKVNANQDALQNAPAYDTAAAAAGEPQPAVQ